ncbi:MAG: secretion protein HlyD, partial [Magnetococcales bacterium]|nr:secretion protein HlyD [Magnetococcales bacterium]
MADSKQAALDLEIDHTRSTRIGWWSLILGLGSFIVWTLLAPLNEGVPAQAKVVLDTRSKPVQH